MPSNIWKIFGFLSMIFAASILLPPSIRAQQFRFPELFEETPQTDPLRKVFGIWGRLLNRMAQQQPPNDDELHLKGATENGADEGADNTIGGPEAGMPRGFMLGGGGRRPSSGPDRIIDEGKLNQILPRLNPNNPTSTTTSTTTTSTTTTSTSAPTTETTTTPTTSTSTTAITTTKTSKKKLRKRKKKPLAEAKASTDTVPTSISKSSASSSRSLITTTEIAKIEKTNRHPPMTILKDEEENKQHQGGTTHVIGATIRLRTSAEKGGGEEIKMEQSSGIGSSGNLSDLVLARMENETAQLIAEIENVLADVEVGPNGGHWLKESGGNNSNRTTFEATTTSEITSTNVPSSSTEAGMTTTDKEGKSEEKEDEDEDSEDDEEDEEKKNEKGKEKEKKDGEDDDKDDGEDDDDEEDEEEDGLETVRIQEVTNGTITDSTTPAAPANSTVELKKSRKLRVSLPEAEEEEQMADVAAQLQLDSTVATSTAATAITSTTANANQTAQNIFNLNSNANSNTNPNFSTMIRPINSVIDGIGPLILPLIGYSRQAFDSYIPYALQRASGVSVFRPQTGALPAGTIQMPPAIAAQHYAQQPQQQLVPFQQSAHSMQQNGVPLSGQMPIPLPHPRQILTTSAQQSSPSTSASIPQQQPIMPPDAPTLELLGRIIEQRRQREREREKAERERMGLQEVSGSAPPSAEQKYFPPVLNRNIQTEPIPPRPPQTNPTTLATPPADDPGYDSGRKGVQDTFHEDSGLMLGQQQSAGPTPNIQNDGKIGMSPTNAMGDGGAGGGFGGGKRPNAAPFAFEFIHDENDEDGLHQQSEIVA